MTLSCCNRAVHLLCTIVQCQTIKLIVPAESESALVSSDFITQCLARHRVIRHRSRSSLRNRHREKRRKRIIFYFPYAYAIVSALGMLSAIYNGGRLHFLEKYIVLILNDVASLNNYIVTLYYVTRKIFPVKGCALVSVNLYRLTYA